MRVVLRALESVQALSLRAARQSFGQTGRASGARNIADNAEWGHRITRNTMMSTATAFASPMSASARCEKSAPLNRSSVRHAQLCGAVSSGRTSFLIGHRRTASLDALRGLRGCSSTHTALRASRVSMKLQTGIVGLPNVGKSTLFNAIVENGAAQAANFPFCTIEPNVGVVGVPDPRLEQLGKLNNSQKIVPATLEFVDIAGLVAGASKGEGLGNKFLANIRECDAIVHVVRCFEDENVIHVDGSVDAVRDIEVISLELVLADLAQAEKRRDRLAKGKSKADFSQAELDALEKILPLLNDGESARRADLSDDERAAVKHLGLLSMKPVIYAANVADSELAGGNVMVERVREFAANDGAKVVVVSAQVESELAALDKAEREEFLADLGVSDESTGLKALIRAAYELLNLQTYFTSGPTETRAWTIVKGMRAPQAAGVIHSDFERGFIRAETIGYKELLEKGSEKVAKEAGLMRSEGKEYIVQEGDVMLFRFNV